MRFSANLGFLYLDLPLIERIGQAARDGFDAVECHFPYDVPAAQMRAALRGLTSQAAWASGSEERLGRLGLGTCCDLTVLDLDPQRATLEQLEAGSVLATVVAGEVVWAAPAR